MKYRVKYKVWLEKGNEFLLGEGSARLLEAIDKYGSLSKAAVSQNISYKKAWDIINEIERLTGERLIISQRGGKGGGGTYLTESGKALLEKFKNIERIFDKTKREIEKGGTL